MTEQEKKLQPLIFNPETDISESEWEFMCWKIGFYVTPEYPWRDIIDSECWDLIQLAKNIKIISEKRAQALILPAHVSRFAVESWGGEYFSIDEVSERLLAIKILFPDEFKSIKVKEVGWDRLIGQTNRLKSDGEWYGFFRHAALMFLLSPEHSEKLKAEDLDSDHAINSLKTQITSLRDSNYSWNREKLPDLVAGVRVFRPEIFNRLGIGDDRSLFEELLGYAKDQRHSELICSEEKQAHQYAAIRLIYAKNISISETQVKIN